MDGATRRRGALERAVKHAPFLRLAAEASPELIELFMEEGTGAALSHAQSIQSADPMSRLRMRRSALALAIALGDLSGELGLEDVCLQLSDFADGAIHDAHLLRTPNAGAEKEEWHREQEHHDGDVTVATERAHFARFSS